MNMTHPDILRMERDGELYPNSFKSECACCGDEIDENKGMYRRGDDTYYCSVACALMDNDITEVG